VSRLPRSRRVTRRRAGCHPQRSAACDGRTQKAEKDGGISQDQVRDLGKQIQDLTDSHIQMLDDLLAKKEAEILQV